MEQKKLRGAKAKVISGFEIENLILKIDFLREERLREGWKQKSFLRNAMEQKIDVYSPTQSGEANVGSRPKKNPLIAERILYK